MSEPPPVRGIIVAHGTLAQGLMDAVTRISGVDALTPISNEGKAPEAIRDELRAALDQGPAVVFTDLQTGSCALVARMACTGNGWVPVVAGANLPMLLDFVFHRDMPLDALVRRLVEKGRDGVRTLDPSPEDRAHRPLSD